MAVNLDPEKSADVDIVAGCRESIMIDDGEKVSGVGCQGTAPPLV